MLPECSANDLEIPDPMCPVTQWSDWSPCSQTCGRGVTIRTRLLLSDEMKKDECMKRRQLSQQQECVQRDECVMTSSEANGEQYSLFTLIFLITSVSLNYLKFVLLLLLSRDLLDANRRRTVPWFIPTVCIRSKPTQMHSIQFWRMPWKSKQLLYFECMPENVPK